MVARKAEKSDILSEKMRVQAYGRPQVAPTGLKDTFNNQLK